MYNVGKVLILGGNRFVGKALAKRIIWEYRYNYVDVFNRSGTGPWATNIIQGDRNNSKDLMKIDFSEYDCIVDMCLFKPWQFLLLDGLIPSSINYIFVSSGAADKRYVDEFGKYGSNKRTIENLLSRTYMNYKIVRPSYIVGEENHRPRLGYYLNKLKKQEPIEINGPGTKNINLVFVQDVVECLINLVKDKNKTQKTYNICGDKPISIVNLIKKLQKWCPNNYEFVQSLESIFPDQTFTFSNKKIKNDYGVTFTSLDDGIKNYIEWFEHKGIKQYGY